MTAPTVAAEREDEAERSALAALASLPGVGGKSMALLKAAFGSLARAASRPGAELAATPGLREDVVESLEAAPDLEKRGAWLVGKAREIGARLVALGDGDYPALLAKTAAPPPLLYVQGALPDMMRVAVVGSRASDRYGLREAERLVERLCGAGIETVSGGATGVDKAAHEKALALGGRTVAVVGTGLLKPYPSSHRPLYERIAEKGAVVSEFALDAGGQPGHFPRRNRTMAGLCDAVVITRGRSDSGALSTCQAAWKASRPVFAVPGRLDEPLAAAPNSLLSSEEARALVTGDELFRALGLATPDPATEPAETVVDLSGFTPTARALLMLLGPGPRHVDELAAEANVPTAQALADLLSLELAGLCLAKPGKYFLRR